MIAAGVQFYEVVVWLHITAVVLAFGPTFAYPMFMANAGRQGPQAIIAVSRAIVTWGRLATTGGLILILLTGLYLADDLWDFGYFFVTWGLAATIVLFGLVHGFFLPRTKQVIAAAEGGRVEEIQAIAAQVKRVGPVANLLVILTIYVMTAKPFT
jgi:hypothetical protein